MTDRAWLSRSLANLDTGAEKAQAWVGELRRDSLRVSQQADSLIDSARRARLASRRLGSAIQRNNCIGVFGPSQAGKSYLVSALARPSNGRLTIRLGDARHDFLRELNPPGDRESTGLVTRFTLQPGEVDPDYPVQVRLLTETDLVKILANSFFLDFDPNSMTIEPVEEAEIREALAAAETACAAGRAPHLDDIALFDLKLYFRQNFRSRIAAFDRTDFWDNLIRLGGGLALRDRAALFGLLWGRIPEFNQLYLHLAEALENIGHAAEARVAIKGVLPRETGSPPEPNTIIDVAMLQRLRSERDRDDPVGLRPLRDGAAGAEASLPRATLSALIAEVSLTIEEQPWPFFEHTDLLDFPGARSRLKLLRMPDAPEEKDERLRELFLRGKIAYLFQRYTDQLELTSMLLCMPPSVAEVKDLAGMVKGWIDATHGATPERRRAVRNALFLVLTKHDMEFQEKGGETEDSRLGKWDRRLHASLLELYGKDGWPQDWDGKPFDNIYFLRNPGMKQVHLMHYKDEAALIEDRPVTGEAFETYRRAFLTSRLTEKHFRDREAAWEAAMEPNDGGVRYLVENIIRVLDPGLKLTQAGERLSEAAAGIAAPLRGLYFAEGDEARREHDAKMLRLRSDLHKAFRRSELRAFATFLRAMMVSPADVRGTFLNVAALREEALAGTGGPGAGGDDARAGDPGAGDPGAGDPGAGDFWAHDPWAEEPAAQEPAPPPKRRERPEIFADRLFNLWAGQLRRFQTDEQALAELGLTAETVGPLIDEMLVGASRAGLAEELAELVRRETQSAGTRWSDVADKVTELAAMRLNDFVAYLGFAETPAAERPGFPESPKHASRPIFSLAGLKHPGPEVGETPEALERLAFVDWGVALRAFGNSNVGHSAGREISDEQNRRLGEILELVEIRARHAD